MDMQAVPSGYENMDAENCGDELGEAEERWILAIHCQASESTVRTTVAIPYFVPKCIHL